MNVRKLAVGVVAAGISTIVAAAGAWACVSGPSVTLNPTKAGPGDTVNLTMRDFRKADPIELRWNDLNAPVLATFESTGSGSPISGQFAVPEDAKPGNYVVILSQKAPDGKVSQMPVRALFTVSGPNGATPVVGAAASPVDDARPTGLVTEDNSVSGAMLALVALGVAGLGMFLAGMAALFAGRRGGVPRAAPVRK